MDLPKLVVAALACASAPSPKTATPIRHLVVIFQENVSFDHYFATYPHALNIKGEPPFHPLPGTPSVNGLSETLLARNPNSAQPRRLDRARAATCDQDHGYGSEQKAFHGGLMDRFVESTGASGAGCEPAGVMDYFDGNTVTALWNYAQRFAMSDDSFGTTFGPSTPGALNLVSGQTHGIVPAALSDGEELLVATGTVVGDPDPELDDCSKPPVIRATGRNVGDLLNAAGVTWGWFEGGFRATARMDGKAACGASHTGADGRARGDYIPHHEPFQYYRSTSNPHHLPPASVDMIGKTDQANHQYDLADFWAAADSENLPQVSFLKAPAYQDGHAGYSDPALEQRFLVETLNRLQKLRSWKDMAVVISYDDSDGWYDHVMGPIVKRSNLDGVDALLAPGSCGAPAPGEYLGRCGYGPRLPLLVLSPYSRRDFVDHSITDQTSILRFIEDNWRLGRIGDGSYDADAAPLAAMLDFSRPQPEPLLLDPETGEPATR